MGINLKAKPFYLSDEDIKWVENTLANLTLDEKIGQVFVDMLWNNTEEEVVERIQRGHSCIEGSLCYGWIQI